MTIEATETTAETTALDFVLALHSMVRSLRRSVTARDVHPTQLLVLAQLDVMGPMRIGALAERVPCSQPTATTVAKGLVAAGLVARVRDAQDGRAIRIQLTDLGRDTIRSTARDQAEVLRDRLDALDTADRDTVLAAVPVLRRMAGLSG
jgi:DNA-binding MarR family transcriptional regulator